MGGGGLQEEVFEGEEQGSITAKGKLFTGKGRNGEIEVLPNLAIGWGEFKYSFQIS